MAELAIAVVFTYVPSEDRTYHTPFTSEDHEDPLSFAHLFRESEEGRGDFPGSLWSVTGNDLAAAIRKDSIMRAMGFDR